MSNEPITEDFPEAIDEIPKDPAVVPQSPGVFDPE